MEDLAFESALKSFLVPFSNREAFQSGTTWIIVKNDDSVTKLKDIQADSDSESSDTDDDEYNDDDGGDDDDDDDDDKDDEDDEEGNNDAADDEEISDHADEVEGGDADGN